MEKADLTSPEYWEAPGVDIRLNPRLDFQVDGLAGFVESELGLDSAVVFATSGSTGSGPKFVVLEKRALLASAEAVNRHLSVGENDRWLCALTTFHVGGLGVWARARQAACPVFGIDGERWDRTGADFVKACRDRRITLTALTPTHLHDVVENEHTAPRSLRAVLIGGGALEDSLLETAVRLGWPILRTYGMTEAASQVATDPPEIARSVERPPNLPVLPAWEVRESLEGRLEIRGAPLMDAYAIRDPQSGSWNAVRPFTSEGYFVTNDRVRLFESAAGGMALAFQGRADDLIKKLGEQVSLEKLRESIQHVFGNRCATILAKPHDRMGYELVAVVEGGAGESFDVEIAEYNHSVAPFERVDQVAVVDALPRTGIGKIAHGRLAEAIGNGRLTLLPASGEIA